MIIFSPFSLTATSLKNFGGTCHNYLPKVPSVRYDAIRFLPPTRVSKSPHQDNTGSCLKNLSTMSGVDGANQPPLGLLTDRHDLSPTKVQEMPPKGVPKVPPVPHQDKLYTKIRLKFIRQLMRHSKQSIATQVFDQSLDSL